MALIDDLVDSMLKERGNSIVDPFPRGAQGQLTNPDYVAKEGQRIRTSLEEGTYGNQPIAAERGGQPQITVVPASGGLEGQPPIIFEQTAWNQNPAQLRQDLQLEDLRTRAASRRFELEEAQRQAPVLSDLNLAKLAHEQAATEAVGSTERRKLFEDARAMKHIAGFQEYMMGAPESGTPEFDSYVRRGVQKFPAILTTKHGSEDLKRIDRTHDISKMVKGLPEGMTPKSITMSNSGPSVTFTARDEIGKKYGITKEEIEGAAGVVVGTPEPSGDPENPTKIKQDNAGTHVAITKSNGKMITIPTSVYEKLGGRYSPETLAARKIAVARKALNDPNSSEAHRAAARKILSGQ